MAKALDKWQRKQITSYLIHNCVDVVVEDLAAYSLRLTPQVIATAKFIGELNHRLVIEAGANVFMVPRSKVKKWVFDTFPFVCNSIINEKIRKKDRRVASTGELKAAHYFYVDDKIVTDCMKYLYKISLPPAGKGYEHGLKTHSWQALAVASYFIHSGLSSVCP